jgi:transposase-like protein
MENAEVSAALLEDLRERGLDTSRPVLVVIDAAKALRAAVQRVWSAKALIQRCQIHKTRNIKAHLPDKHWPELVRQLSAAYQETSFERARSALETTAKWLARISPDAAASLWEGLKETLTVVRLGLSDPLRRTLSSTNPIKSALSVTREVTRRVKRWCDGDHAHALVCRWPATCRGPISTGDGTSSIGRFKWG